jgi:hypothetical protein
MRHALDYAPRLEEKTICVRESARQRPMRAAIATVMLALAIGGVAGARMAHASSSPTVPALPSAR